MNKRKGNSPVMGEQLVIPLDVDLAFQSGVKKKAFEGTKSADLYRPLIEKIRVIDNFNPRIKTKKYRLGIEKLARDMARDGFDETQTLTVFLIYEDGQHIICLHDGHRRLEAVFLAPDRRRRVLFRKSRVGLVLATTSSNPFRRGRRMAPHP